MDVGCYLRVPSLSYCTDCRNNDLNICQIHYEFIIDLPKGVGFHAAYDMQCCVWPFIGVGGQVTPPCLRNQKKSDIHCKLL